MISWFPRFYIVYLILQELHATRKELNHEFDFQLYLPIAKHVVRSVRRLIDVQLRSAVVEIGLERIGFSRILHQIWEKSIGWSKQLYKISSKSACISHRYHFPCKNGICIRESAQIVFLLLRHNVVVTWNE